MFLSLKMCAHEGLPSCVFIKSTWEIKTVNFTWSCSGLVFWKRLQMDLGALRSASYRTHVSCPGKGMLQSEIAASDISEGKRTTAAEDSLELLNADFVQCDWGKHSFARSLWEGLMFCGEEQGKTIKNAVLVMSLIVFPDAMPVMPHAVCLWQAVPGCSFAFCCVLRFFKSHLCSFQRL